MTAIKAKLIVCFALFLSGGLMGCSTVIANREAQGDIQLPIRFAGYQDLYTFIADESLETTTSSPDAEMVFKLAADSKTDIVNLDYKEIPYVYVIESHYFNGGIYDKIRGAQGNGLYFVVRPLAKDFTKLDTCKGFELVGILDGNTYAVRHINETPQFVCYWHMSTTEHPETIYNWNGKYFEKKR